MAEHGTVAARRQCHDGPHGGACGPCRRAHADEMNEGNRDRAARLRADPTMAPHGESSTYQNWMCRCTRCRDAQRLASLRVKRGHRAAPFGREWLNA